MAWRAEVITNGEGGWISNRLRFETEKEAGDYLVDLAQRWTWVTDVRVVECDEAPNYRYINNQLLGIVPQWIPQMLNSKGDEAP